MSQAEAAWLMAGSVLELLDIGGPDTVREQLVELPRSQREDVVRVVRYSGYPALLANSGERLPSRDFCQLCAELGS